MRKDLKQGYPQYHYRDKNGVMHSRPQDNTPGIGKGKGLRRSYSDFKVDMRPAWGGGKYTAPKGCIAYIRGSTLVVPDERFDAWCLYAKMPDREIAEALQISGTSLYHYRKEWRKPPDIVWWNLKELIEGGPIRSQIVRNPEDFQPTKQLWRTGKDINGEKRYIWLRKAAARAMPYLTGHEIGAIFQLPKYTFYEILSHKWRPLERQVDLALVLARKRGMLWDGPNIPSP